MNRFENLTKHRRKYLKNRYQDFVKGGKAKITPQTKKETIGWRTQEQVT